MLEGVKTVTLQLEVVPLHLLLGPANIVKVDTTLAGVEVHSKVKYQNN